MSRSCRWQRSSDIVLVLGAMYLRVKGLAVETICDTDEQAIEQARQYVDGCLIEVWNRARLVKRLASED